MVDFAPREFGDENKECLSQMGKFLMDKIQLMKRNYELVEARKQAESAHQLKSAFLANMSHEIRTPLTSLLGMIDILASDSLISDYQRKSLQLMQECGSTLHHILNDVLDFSKIEAKQLRIETVEFDLEALVTSTVNICESKAESQNVDLKVAYVKTKKRASCGRQLLGDPTRLKQVLWNLIDNAIKFSPPSEGCVNVRVQECERTAELPHSARIKMEKDVNLNDDEIFMYCEIEDNGEGIPNDQLLRIFSPFEQLDSSTTRKHGGTGLGLSIVTNILKLLGGSLHAESQLGKGSKFWFAMKLKMADQSSDSLTEECSSNITSSNSSRLSRSLSPKSNSSESMEFNNSKRILVAEDNKMIRTMVGKRLTDLGYIVKLTCDGQEAIDELKRVMNSDEQFFDIFVCDMFMPVKDGAATMSVVRKFPEPYKSVPIIAFTADVLEESVDRYLKCGADAVIGKPVDWKRFESILQNPPSNAWKTRDIVLDQ
jgi:signal transduction histidine kinase/CheY-like chemotaxis protein